MNPIVMAVASVSVIGLLSAVVLAVASKVMAVKVDERFPLVRAELPGANCGACGYAGCDAYAQALIDDPGVKTNLCIPGGGETARKLSEALGVAFEEVAAKVAVVKCRGDCEHTSDKMDYRGPESCKAAKMFYGGKGSCSYGCLGFGDCAAVCPYDAICVENGIAHIDPRRCVGCGACAGICPSKVIEVIPADAKVYVSCNSRDKGAVVRKNCKAGCIACKKCEKVCPSGAISVSDNLASIHYDKCTSCRACVGDCLVSAILERK